jgi:RNA polymerase sigma factor (sigma-70 family)
MDDDKTLVAAARRGDESAWGGIYDRYADKLHDHCFRILRDRDEAADALHDAFIAASRNLHQLRDPERLRPWLYSIARHCSLRRLKARERVELTDAPDDMMAPEADLGRGVAAAELGELVWAAAEGLNPRDQALLDLSVRQGLEGQDLADAMGTTLNNSYVMLSRMRDQVERSLGALLIARLGRDDCEELDELLADWDGKFSPLLRKRVARHVDGCDICTHKRSTVASPLALLAVVPVAPAPAMLKGRIISSVRNVETVDGPPIKFNRAGFPILAGGAQRRPGLAWLATAAAVFLLLGGLVLAGGGDSGGSDVTTAAGSIGERERVTTTTEATTTTSTLPADGSTSSVPGGGAPNEKPGGSATTAPGGGSPTTVPSGPTTTVGVEVASVTFSPATINTKRCASGPYTTTVTAKINGSPRMVRIKVDGFNGGGVQYIDMTDQGGGTYTGSFGNFSISQGTAPSSLQFVVQAFNASREPGQKFGTVKIHDCPPAATSTTQTTIGTGPGPIG